MFTTIVGIVCAAAGFAGGAYFIKKGYEAKLEEIGKEVRMWEGHRIGEVRTIVSRIKALL